MTESMRAENKFAFNCAVTDADEKYIACQFNRYRHWRGERTIKPECGVAMTCGKCPALMMMKAENETGQALFYNTEDRVHKLPVSYWEQYNRTLFYASATAHLEPELAARLLENKRYSGAATVGLPVAKKLPPKHPEYAWSKAPKTLDSYGKDQVEEVMVVERVSNATSGRPSKKVERVEGASSFFAKVESDMADTINKATKAA